MPRKANKIHLYPSNEKDDFYENGVVGLAGLAADIPDHKRVEQALRQQAQIIDQIHDSVVSTDLDGHVIRWNRGAERLFGYTSKEAVGKHISFVYPEDQRDFLQHQVIRPLKEKGEHDIEVRMHRKSGEKFDAHLSLSLLRDDQGGIIGMIGYSIDITDRKQAQEALQKAHDALEIRVLERTAALVEANAALQAEIAERRRVEKQIKARTRQQEAVAMLGQQALEGKPLSELMKEAVSLVARVLEVEYAKVLELLPGGKAFLLRAGVGWKEGIVGNEIVDAGIDSQAGYTFALLSKAPVIVEDLRAEARFTAPPLLRDHAVVSGMSTVIYGREFPIGVLGAHTVRRRKFTKNDSHFLQSIANVLAQAIDRNRSEEERARLLANEHQARRDAEEANRAKDDFLAMVSHELRTPLNSIMGWAQILQRGEVDQATYRIALKSIGGNAKAQAQLIEDLLDVSRIIAGNLRLDLRVTSLPPMIEAAIDSVRPAAEAKGIRIETTLAPAADTVLADPDRLQQVVTNLLSNAIKFTPEGGRVRVDLERVNPAIQIRVSDTGIGISAEFLPYVFDRFRQAKSAGSRAREGLGLGLAIVRHLVELHGGTVQAASEGEGKGATFTVNLPIMAVRVNETELKRAGSEMRKESGDIAALEGIQVLLIDDGADARRLLEKVLNQYGARVTSVASTAEALEAIQEQKYDVIVSDIGMPGEDGYALIRQVRAMETEKKEKIPAVALTAHAGAQDRRRALRARFQMHPPKPVEPIDLATAITILVGR